jgi:hypothetical protein
MPDIASEYDGIMLGPDYSYTYEQQSGKPVDGTVSLPRKLSPFTIRFVLPELIGDETGVDVNLIGRAANSAEENNRLANQARERFGIASVTPGSSQLTSLRAEYTAGQFLTNKSSLTTRSVIVDAATLADIRYQVERLLTVPPLTLLVNPNNMQVSYSPVQNHSDLTRKGFVFQRWGEEQPSISFSGSTGAFTAGSNVVSSLSPQSVSPNGVQFASKRDSAAFQNFATLYQIYRSNGYIYDSLGESNAMLMVGAIAIDYDQFTYVGHIESFTYAYQAESPHRIEWNMDFKVSKTYDHATAPVVVLPEASPSSSAGSPSIEELAREISRTPTRGSSVAGGFVQVSGTEQYAQTPLQALTPSGLVR